ncbi:MAG: TetR family transcriptional regulator [Streptosporangiales bacterium]|nr:TetR family transcriptional regulator [Streptosporangiales bacterium]
MGHREDLLVGALRCLTERGYARTTARDIVAASGTNLASIGYHFGSKDALLYEALMAIFDQWGDQIDVATADDDASPLERFGSMFGSIVASFANGHEMLVASIEVMAQAERVPQIREHFRDDYEQAREELAASVLADAEPVDDESARAVGSFVLALLNGLALQWMIDPERAPSGADMVTALRVLAGREASAAGDGS